MQRENGTNIFFPVKDKPGIQSDDEFERAVNEIATQELKVSALAILKPPVPTLKPKGEFMPEPSVNEKVRSGEATLEEKLTLTKARTVAALSRVQRLLYTQPRLS